MRTKAKNQALLASMAQWFTQTNAVSDTHIKLSCLNNTESTMINIGLNNITQGKDWNVINDGRNEYSYNWINEEKQLRMLTIKYI